MFWGDDIIAKFLTEYGEEAKKRPLVLRDEKTLSGRPHIGSLRSFVMHATLSDILTSRDIPHHYFYEINDTDAFDSVPPYVPQEFSEHLGKRLCDVPSPDSKAENYAMFFAQAYLHALTASGYFFESYRNSEKYSEGAYDEYIRLALEKRQQIRVIYQEVSGSEKPESWYPCQVICDQCGKIATTRLTGFDGKKVQYVCDADTKYVKGCGFSGKKSPFRGNATLPWKVEWAAKFCMMKVDLEGAGKDHYAAGGSRLVTNRICEEIFGRKHPFDVRHEFILIGGAKMSSSAGTGATASEVFALLPRYIFRFMMIQKDVMQTINFSPEGDTIPILFDQYDEICRDYFSEANTEMKDHKKRFLELTHADVTRKHEDFQQLNRFLPRFIQVAFFVQMPHVDIYKKFEEIKGAPLCELDRAELDLRIEYAKKWLEVWSPEKYIFKIHEKVPESADLLDSHDREFLKILAEFLKKQPDATGEMIQTFIYERKTALGLDSAKVFRAIYLSLLGKDSGPKAGWLLEALDNQFLLQRFEEVSKISFHG
ncbi:lysine--tRNA ligase [Candidatus Peregrinibacteria bacterium]|nr:lysine--tRNA ligase [Candidatus Peregrinibacteria bacterium]